MSSTAEAGARPVFDPVPALAPDAILLHVGVHKTGTTAVQAALADARPDLHHRGILYPGKRKAQHRSALALNQRTWGWANKGGSVVDESVYDWLIRKATAHEGRVAISSEFFCEGDADAAKRVVRDLGADRVHVVIGLRNLGRLLPSSWQQYLKYGLDMGYIRWLTGVFENEGRATPSFWRRNDHGAVVQRWADAAGPENVTVMVLEEVDLSSQFRTFAQFLDVPEDLLVSRMDLTSNRSMTAAEASFLLRINSRVKAEMTWDEYQKYVRRGVALRMVEDREPAADEPRLHTPDWALDAAAEHGARDAGAIAATGVQVLGSLDALAARVGSPPPTPDSVDRELPTDAAVQAVIAVIQATRTSPELTAKQLRAELIARTKEDLKLRWRLKTLRP